MDNIIKNERFKNYFKTKTKKRFICLHTTGGHSAEGAINHWCTRKNGKGTVAAQYIIDENGKIINIFPDEYWSHCSGRGAIDKEIIHIEIVNAGLGELTSNHPWVCVNDIGVELYPNVSCCIENGKQLNHEMFTVKQVQSIYNLIAALCEKHKIPFKIMMNDYTDLKKLKDKSGIITHAQINKNKSDIPKYMIEGLVAMWNPFKNEYKIDKTLL